MSLATDSIGSWIAGVDATMSAVPAELAQAASSGGDFDSILAGVQAALSGSPFSSAGASPAATASAGDTTAADASGDAGSASSPPATSAPGGGPSGASVVSEAQKFLGVPYLWGGTSPSGFDCSGLVQYVYGQLGVSLPRTSEEQANAGTAVPSLADAEPGDLVFFPGSDGTAASPGHVGIYIGNGQMIDAPKTGEDVSIQPVGNPTAIRRVLTAPAPAQAAPPAAAAPATSTAPSPAGTASASGANGGNGGSATPAVPSPVNVPPSLAPDFLASAAKYGLPASLLTAVASTESGFNPNAVSSAGAEGIMQLMPSTAAGLGVDPFNPPQAIDGAAQLLSGYLKQYGSMALALAAYNAGPPAVAQYGGVPPFPETQAYVNNILQLMGGN